MVGAGTGGCFMMIGRAVGRFCPCSFILISFMAIENSRRSILPSLFISARVLPHTQKNRQAIRARLFSLKKWFYIFTFKHTVHGQDFSPDLSKHRLRKPRLNEEVSCLLPYRQKLIVIVLENKLICK